MRPDVSDTPSLELLRLNNQLCFALYAATRVVTKAYREKLGELGLTYPQYLVLIVLWEHDGITLSKIGEHLMLDSGTLTPLVKRLETGGFVTRKRSKSDEREVIVALTPHGRSLQTAAASVREYIVCRLNMTEDQIGALRIDLMAMIDTVAADGSMAADDKADCFTADDNDDVLSRSAG